jgi:molybdate transport system substrate-binding protein
MQSPVDSTVPLLRGISSMATRLLLTELADAYRAATGIVVQLESVGGVDAAKRVQAGEVFDAVFLASDAIDKLLVAGHLVPGSRVDLVHSGVAVAVQAGAPAPDISSEEAVRAAVLAAPTLSYSTGPSGVALAKLFERWGIAGAIQNRIVQAPPGVPVGALVARGEVALGFQQLSELIHVAGISIVAPLPDAIQITTTFSAGIGSQSQHKDAVQALLAFLAAPQAAAAKQRQGMQPA